MSKMVLFGSSWHVLIIFCYCTNVHVESLSLWINPPDDSFIVKFCAENNVGSNPILGKAFRRSGLPAPFNRALIQPCNPSQFAERGLRE